MNRGGRPYTIAILPEESDTILIREMFYRVIDSLTHQQSIGLSRALCINPDSVRTHYKTRQRFPGVEVALRVLEWNKRGKPLEKRKNTVSYLDL